MKKFLIAAALLACACSGPAEPATTFPSAFQGDWSFVLDLADDHEEWVCPGGLTFYVDARPGSVIGEIYTTSPCAGVSTFSGALAEDGSLSFTIPAPCTPGAEVLFEGRIAGDEISLHADIEDVCSVGPLFETVDFEGVKA